MKKSHRWAILAVVVSFGGLISLAVAQAPSGARPTQAASGAKLALIDVTKIFKAHTRFDQQMKDMKRDVQAAEATVKAKRDEINHTATEILPTYNKGTPQYAATEEQLANDQAKLAVDVNRMKSVFLQREAKIYHDVYQEIWQATDYFCKQHGIDMVLRFNGDAVDIQRPDSVLAYINKPVVWYDPGLDITDAILQDVNRSAGNPAAADLRGGPVSPATPFGGR